MLVDFGYISTLAKQDLTLLFIFIKQLWSGTGISVFPKTVRPMNPTVQVKLFIGFCLDLEEEQNIPKKKCQVQRI